MKKGEGAFLGFSEEYWRENYSDAEEMDGIGNVETHVTYLKSFLDLEYVQVASLIDFGFGLGHMFRECMKEFVPYRVTGIEPSKEVFDRAISRSGNLFPQLTLSFYPGI